VSRGAFGPALAAVGFGVAFQCGGCIRAAAPGPVPPPIHAPSARSSAAAPVALARALEVGEAGSAPELLSDGRYRMGTVLELTLVPPVQQAGAAPAALARAFGTVALLDGLLSRFDPASDVSRLNASAGQGLQPVDPQTRELLGFCRRAAELTRGGFDVTVGPLVELWTLAADRGRVPDEQELADALGRVGADRILLDSPAHGPAHAPGHAGLEAAGMALDLGGVAKGFALDVAVAELRESGIDRALLSFGRSSIWGLGSPTDETGWRLLLESPSQGYSGIVELSDRALSVSSSLGQWSEIAGRRYGHVIDPRTGRPLGGGKQAVVVARSAALAEVLSTALLVLPGAEGLAIVEGQEAEARIVDGQGRVRQSSGWQQATHFEPIASPPPAAAETGATAASPAGLRSGA
jgi:thiamine biosynthesis lipoprotein